MGNYKMGAEQKESQPIGSCVGTLHGVGLALNEEVSCADAHGTRGYSMRSR